MVAAWIKELTGVGPSMASGSHTYRGSCADFPQAPTKNKMVMAVTVPGFQQVGILENLGEVQGPDAVLPKGSEEEKHARRKPKSPTRFTTKAFFPAFEAESFSYQKPIRRYEQRPRPPSHKHQQEVVCQNEVEHHEDKQVEVGKIPRIPRVAMHISDGINMDEETDPCHTRTMRIERGSIW